MHRVVGTAQARELAVLGAQQAAEAAGGRHAPPGGKNAGPPQGKPREGRTAPDLIGKAGTELQSVARGIDERGSAGLLADGSSFASDPM